MFTVDGKEIFARNMEEFYMPDDATPLASKNCALLDIAFGINDGDMLLSTMGCCYHEFIDGNVLLEDGDADIEEYIGRLKLQYRPVDRESIYYPARYFGERMRFIEDDKYFVKLAYVEGAGYDDYVKRAVAKHSKKSKHGQRSSIIR